MDTWKAVIMDKLLSGWVENQEGQTWAGLLLPTKIFFSIFPLGRRNDGQGGTSRTFHFELTHGRENGRTHFARHRLG